MLLLEIQLRWHFLLWATAIAANSIAGQVANQFGSDSISPFTPAWPLHPATSASSSSDAGPVSPFAPRTPIVQPAPEAMTVLAQTAIAADQPFALWNLAPGTQKCISAHAPSADLVRVLVSVVALAGVPSLAGSWQPVVPEMHLAGDAAGFRVLARTETREGPLYYACVAAIGHVAGDFMVTIRVEDASAQAPVLRPRPSYPLLWPLGTGLGAPTSAHFLVEAGDLEATRISVVPLELPSGPPSSSVADFEISVFKDDSCKGEPLAAASRRQRPALLDLPPQLVDGFANPLCISIQGSGVVAVTAGPRTPGPYLPQAVSGAGMVSAGESGCQPIRMLAGADGVDTIITVAAEGASLSLSAFLSSELLLAPSPTSHWQDASVPPILFVPGREVRSRAAKIRGGAGEVQIGRLVRQELLSVLVCRADASVTDTPFKLTATVVDEATPIADGIPFTTLPAPGMHEFQFHVPNGATSVTLSAQASPGDEAGTTISLVADTRRRMGELGAYHWQKKVTGSNPTLRFTVVEELANDEVHFLNCASPCNVYISASAHSLSMGEDGSGSPVVLQLLAESGQGVVPSPQISPPSPPPRLPLPLPPQPSVLVATTTTVTTTIDMTIMTSGEPHDEVVVQSEFLKNGSAKTRVVEAGQYDRYRFRVGAAEAKLPMEVRIEVESIVGKLSVYASCDGPPGYDNYAWSATNRERSVLAFTTLSPKFQFEDCHIAVFSDQSAEYRIRIKWDSIPVSLDGDIEVVGHVMRGDARPFFLDTGRIAKSISLRAHVWTDSIALCVADAIESQDLHDIAVDDIRCRHSVIAGSGGSAEQSLAALDLTPADFSTSERIMIIVRGIGAYMGSFALRALVDDAPSTLLDGQELVDAVGPSCCAQTSNSELGLRRYYVVSLSQPAVGAVITLSAQGDARLRGTSLEVGPPAIGDGFDEITGWQKTNVEDAEQGRLEVLLPFSQLAQIDVGNKPFMQVIVETASPLNYSIAFRLTNDSSSASLRPPSVPGTLIAGEQVVGDLSRVEGHASTEDAATFVFAPADPGGFFGTWHLRVQQCYGRIAVELPDILGEQPTSRSDFEVALAAPPGIADAPMVLRPSGGSATSVYEVELLAPGNDLSPIVFPSKPTIALGIGVVTFQPASVELSRLPAELQEDFDFEIRYSLIALQADDKALNANSTCGLEEAVRRGSGTSSIIAVGVVSADRIEAPLPTSPSGEEFLLNVVVELREMPHARVIASRAYIPIQLPATSKMDGGPQRDGVAELPDVNPPPRPSSFPSSRPKPPQESEDDQFPSGFIMLLGGGALWWWVSGNSCQAPSGGARQGAAESADMMELEGTVQTETDRANLLTRGGRNYVPPSV